MSITPSAALWNIIQPAAATNLIRNPSFEANVTDGWTLTGTGAAVALATGYPWVGARNAKITAASSGNAVLYSNNIALANGATIYGQCRLTRFSSASCDITIYDATNTTTRATAEPASNGVPELVTVSWTNNTGGDVNVQLRIRNKMADGTTNIHVDACQMELTQETTYLDGDMTGGYYWNGVPHNSASTRRAEEATGGLLLNLATDLDFVPSAWDGTGMPPVNNLSSPLALRPGELFEAQTINARSFSITGGIYGDSVSDFHRKKQALILALNPNNVKINQRSQPRTLRYTGAGTQKEIRAVYDGGLEQGLPDGSTQKDIPLRFRAPDPLFYEVGETGKVTDTTDSATARVIAAKIDGLWDVLGPPDSSGTYTQVNAICEYNRVLYIGGDFLNFDNIANADYIVQYDLDAGTYSAMSTGRGGIVRRIKAGPDGLIYVCASDGFWSWDGSSWTEVGSPSSTGSVFDCAFMPNGDIYIVGPFTNFDGIAAADGIAYYDVSGSAWSAEGSGITAGTGYDLEINELGDIYVCGSVTTINGVAVKRVARKLASTGTWESLGQGIATGASEICFDALLTDDGRYWFGGNFTTDGDGNTLEYCAVFDGNTIREVDGFVSNVIRVEQLPNGDMLFGFVVGGTIPYNADGLLAYNGSGLYRLDIDLPGATPTVYGLFVNRTTGAIYVGFDTTGTATYSGSVTASYTGTALAYPKIIISRSGGTSATLREVRNYTTGAVLYFDYDLLDGETLTIDCRPGGQSIVSSFWGNVYGRLLANSDFGNFHIMPGNGSSLDNVVTFWVEEGGGPTVTAIMTYKTAYISED